MDKLLCIFVINLLATNCNDSKDLIKDCPEEKIINKMPSTGNSTIPNEYYIYKGERRELTDFDSEWISKNCQVKTTEVF